MNIELAKDMTYGLMKSASAEQPERNDFVFPIKYQSETFHAIWTRDINVSQPEWHLTIEKQEV